jgi:multiple sugar transport system permease protein
MSVPSLLPRRRARAASMLPRPDVVVVDYPRTSIGGLATNLILAALGVAFFAPLIWLLFTSLDANAGPALQWPKLTFSNFTALFNSTRLQPFLNSLYLAGVSTLVTTVLALLAAYGLSRRHIPLKRSFMLIVLFASGLPITALLVPVYQLFVRFNWIDSLFFTSLFLAAAALPFAIWLLKNFIDQIPEEFEEAAALEGAGSFQILLRVILPNALPGVAVTAMVTFIAGWGAFIVPLVLNSDPNSTPGSVAIYEFLRINGVVNYGQLASYSILFSIPVVVLYLIASRWISGAFTFSGGVKG